MTVQEFSQGDREYLEWLHSYPHGFVISTDRRMSPDYMILHHAWCGSILHYGQTMNPGAFTERKYIKICSTDLSSLRDWVRQHGRPDGTFSSEHSCFRS